MPASRGAFPGPAVDVKPAAGKQTAVLAEGCLWRLEAVFNIMDGVDDAISGYSGGTKETAKYDIVSTGLAGHAEAVLILPRESKRIAPLTFAGFAGADTRRRARAVDSGAIDLHRQAE